MLAHKLRRVGYLPPVEITFGSAHTDFNNNTIFTFTDVSFGAPSAGRAVIIAVGGGKDVDVTISSVTVGGISATQAVYRGSTSGAWSSLWVAEVPTGTSGTVVVTWSGPMLRAAIHSFRMVNHTSIIPIDTNSALGSGSTFDVSLDLVNGSGVVATSLTYSATTITWSGVTEVAETYVESRAICSGTHIATANGSRTISVTADPVSSTAVTSAAWR